MLQKFKLPTILFSIQMFNFIEKMIAILASPNKDKVIF